MLVGEESRLILGLNNVKVCEPKHRLQAVGYSSPNHAGLLSYQSIIINDISAYLIMQELILRPLGGEGF